MRKQLARVLVGKIQQGHYHREEARDLARAILL